MNEKTYDKVTWHFPAGKGCPSLNAAKIHFEVIMEWLKDNDFLSPEGLEAFDIGVDSDFALTTKMVTLSGNAVLEKCYGKWLETVNYGQIPAVDMLNACLKC